MTIGETQDKHGGQETTAGGEDKRLRPSFTTLSTIAVQAGQSLIVISVLKSGSVVHLQLVQVHPGLCEIGSNHEENQELIQTQKQLMEKLKKHEQEVLSAVETSERRKQRRRKQERGEEEEELQNAMTASLKEGWLLLLHLLERRQEVLMMAAEFYRRVMEFSSSIDRAEDLQVSADTHRQTDMELLYESMRRDLLGKSLQVLTSSSLLLQKLRQLQRTEALQRRGGVLQGEGEDGQETQEEKGSQLSRGAALRLEELVETLQDRRRRADQSIRQQLQQAKNLTTNTTVHEEEPEESKETSFEDLTILEIPDQDQLSEPEPDLRPGSTREARGLKSGPTPRPKHTTDQEPRSSPDLRSRLKYLQPDSRPGLQSGSRPDLPFGHGLQKTKILDPVETLNPPEGSNPDLLIKSRLEETRTNNPEPGPGLVLKPGSDPEKTKDLTRPGPQSGFKSNRPESRPEEDRNLRIESTSDQIPESRSGSRLDVKPDSGLKSIRDLEPGSRLKEIQTLKFGIKLNLRPKLETRDPGPGAGSEVETGSRPVKTPELSLNLRPKSRADLRPEETTDPSPGPRPDPQSESRSEELNHLQNKSRSEPESRPGPGPTSGWNKSRPGQKPDPETRDISPESRSEETTNLRSDSEPEGTRSSDPGSGSGTQPGPGPQETREPEARTRTIPDQKPGSKLDPGSEENQDLSEEPTETRPGFGLVLKLEENLDPQPRSRPDLEIESRLNMTKNLESESRPEPEPGQEKTRTLQTGSRPEMDQDLQSGSGSEDEDLHHLTEVKTKDHQVVPVKSSSVQVAEKQSMLGQEKEQTLTNQRQQLLSSCEQLVDKIWVWVQRGSSDLSNSSEAGQRLSEAEDSLNTHLQLHRQAQSAGHDAVNMTQILDQMRTLQTDLSSRTGLRSPCEPKPQPPPLKVLTEQLKEGADTDQTSPLPADPAGPLSPELTDRVDLVLKELQSLSRQISSHLQLLEPYVRFLRVAQKVEEELEQVMEVHRRRSEEEETQRSVSGVKKEQETLTKFLTCQELGNDFIRTVSEVSGPGLNVEAMVSLVHRTLEQLSRTKQELVLHHQVQIQQQEHSRTYQQRFLKTLQDLKGVSELLDSCTQMDLGSDLHTTRLLDHFKRARPHFKQLDAEVEDLVKTRETQRGVQVQEEDLSALLELQERVKTKIHQSESILDLSSSFHLASQQLEALLKSEPQRPLTGPKGLHGSSEAEESLQREKQNQIQGLLKTASALKTDICTAVDLRGGTGFRVDQLEARLLSLDSLCVLWLKEARQQEQNQQLTRQFNNDINQLRDAFKDVKKRFSNLKFNYMKRNDRTRNMKAVRNQLQQVEVFEEKLQALRKRLQSVTARLGSEVKDGGVAREAEDAINELQRQMGEFERGVSEHQRTLEMTCRLQQAMEEYQFWCEEASATIARVGKFSSQCRSTEAVAVLHQQFEKFVWPTVPQQEERISQISELAVRLHGAEEGQRYIERTVSKHSEMVESIRELSDGLMQLEAKLKMEKLGQQQEEEKKERETERRREDEMEEKEKKGNRKWKKKETTDQSRITQETTEMYELKETGHTPELTAEHDGKDVPVKRQTAANRRPPSQRSSSQEADTRTVIPESSAELQPHRGSSSSSSSSYCSTHTFSLSCSAMEANRRIHAIHSQSKPEELQATPPLSGICPSSFPDVQREFQSKDPPKTSQQVVSAPLCQVQI
ncbi:uncharacterized protein ccdc141 [Xyrichtys novacula]|uniref:Uncharacterized protein ccdc141 n=1 Tax=Xyrichtys novacula TaxID=13765 RepID=A0AAV1GXL6_XYRNO|nr:uncharacterized protein ccdc141 [Xyrichtys novacula]